jgi:hypothetical protein
VRAIANADAPSVSKQRKFPGGGSGRTGRRPVTQRKALKNKLAKNSLKQTVAAKLELVAEWLQARLKHMHPEEIEALLAVSHKAILSPKPYVQSKRFRKKQLGAALLNNPDLSPLSTCAITLNNFISGT